MLLFYSDKRGTVTEIKRRNQKLNEKQRAFIKEYAVDGCITKAAIRAGYSPKTAGQQGSKLLKKVKPLIDKELSKKRERTGYDADRIVEMHQEIYDKAMASGNLAPAVSSLKAITDLMGIEPAKKLDVNHSGQISVIVRVFVDVEGRD